MMRAVESGRWLESAEWMRDGRGRDWRFHLPTDALVDALTQTSADLGDELELLACSRTEGVTESLSIYSAEQPGDLAVAGPWQYFLRFQSLTPTIPAPEPLSGVGWPAVFAINGLVLLHHPDPGRPHDPPRSSIGITNRVIHQRSGEMREHKDYDKVFRTLKRKLQAAGAIGVA
jgi:hypothetical protein